MNKYLILGIAVIVAFVGIFGGFYLLTGFGTEETELREVNSTFDWQYGCYYTMTEWFVAKEKGWFEEAGIDMSLSEGRGAPMALETVALGRKDITATSISSFYAARAQGMPLITVLIGGDGNPSILADASKIKSIPEDLPGKRFGSVAPSFIYYYWESYVDEIGLEDYEDVPIGWDPVAPFKADKIDAIGSTYSYYKVMLEREGIDINMYDLKDTLGMGYYTGLVVTEYYARENPELLKDLIEVVGRANAYVYDHPEESARIIMEYNPELDFEEVLELLDHQGKHNELWDKNGRLSHQKMEEIEDFLLKYKLQEKEVGVENIYDWSFLPDKLPIPEAAQ